MSFGGRTQSLGSSKEQRLGSWSGLSGETKGSSSARASIDSSMRRETELAISTVMEESSVFLEAGEQVQLLEDPDSDSELSSETGMREGSDILHAMRLSNAICRNGSLLLA